MRVRVKYFGHLKDVTGRNEEMLEVKVGTINEILDELETKYRDFEKLRGTIRLAKGDKILTLSSQLEDGDEIALLPPVSGG